MASNVTSFKTRTGERLFVPEAFKLKNPLGPVSVRIAVALKFARDNIAATYMARPVKAFLISLISLTSVLSTIVASIEVIFRAIIALVTAGVRKPADGETKSLAQKTGSQLKATAAQIIGAFADAGNFLRSRLDLGSKLNYSIRAVVGNTAG